MICSTKEMLLSAQKERRAIAAFNIHNMESLQAVVQAAEDMKSPVIIAASPATLKYAGAAYLGAMFKVAAERSQYPMALHLDHCKDFSMLVACIQAGFTSLMIDASHLPYEENIKTTRKAVELGHSVGVAVEAELGMIAGKEDDLSVDEKLRTYTNPDQAADFVSRTGIDSLAVAIGTAHGVYRWEPKLDFSRLQQIREKVSIPLVLHGASGISDDMVRKAISLGICKVNIATELKLPMAAAIRNSLSDPSVDDPRVYMSAGKKEVARVARHKIEICSGE